MGIQNSSCRICHKLRLSMTCSTETGGFENEQTAKFHIGLCGIGINLNWKIKSIQTATTMSAMPILAGKVALTARFTYNNKKRPCLLGGL